jgi:hypothetical protein
MEVTSALVLSIAVFTSGNLLGAGAMEPEASWTLPKVALICSNDCCTSGSTSAPSICTSSNTSKRGGNWGATGTSLSAGKPAKAEAAAELGGADRRPKGNPPEVATAGRSNLASRDSIRPSKSISRVNWSWSIGSLPQIKKSTNKNTKIFKNEYFMKIFIFEIIHISIPV